MDENEFRRTRRNDYDSSIEGAEAVTRRAPNQRQRLLLVFYRAGDMGLTDEEAAALAGLDGSCYWKRCGELRTVGLIAFTGQKRVGRAGVSRNISVITEEGETAVTGRTAA